MSTPPKDCPRGGCASIEELQGQRADDEQARVRLIRWALGICGSAVAICALPLVSLLIDVGAMREQQRQMREDVSRVLVVSERLAAESTTVQARIDESARDRAALHESIRAVEAKMWEQRRAIARPGVE